MDKKWTKGLEKDDKFGIGKQNEKGNSEKNDNETRVTENGRERDTREVTPNKREAKNGGKRDTEEEWE